MVPQGRLVAVPRHERALPRRRRAALAQGFFLRKRRRGPHAADAHVFEVRVPQQPRVVFFSLVAVPARRTCHVDGVMVGETRGRHAIAATTITG